MSELGLLAIALAGISAFWALVAPRHAATGRAAAAAIIVLAMVPWYGPNRMLVGVVYLGVLGVLALALMRQGTGAQAVPFAAAALIISTGISEAWGFGAETFALIAVQSICLILAAIAFRVSGRNNDATPVRAYLFLIPIEFVLAVLEQLRIIGPVWLREETALYQNIAVRVNGLLPDLTGRSIGTFSHPILLGVFAAAGLVLAIVSFVRSGRRAASAVLVLLAGTTLVLSGTRSAAAAAVAAIAVMFALAPGRMRPLRILFGLIVSVAAVFSNQILPRLGLADVEDSVSYVHRTEVLRSIPDLLRRPFENVLFGSGSSSVTELFAMRIVQGYGDYEFFDNQYVRTLAIAGIVGLGLLLLAILRGWMLGNMTSRALLVTSVVMMASFDALTWTFSFLVLVMGISGSLATSTRKKPTSPENPKVQSTMLSSRGQARTQAPQRRT